MVIAGAVAACAPALIEWAFGETTVHIPPTVHFYAVGMTALGAAAASIALTWIGARFSDTRTVLIGTAFAVMAALLALHGLGTPGFIFPEYQYGIVMITGGLTLPLGAAILALSAFRLPPFLQGVRPLLVLQGVMLTAIIGLGIAGLVKPEILPKIPAANSHKALALLAFGLLLFAILTLRAGRTYLLTRRLADLLVVIGLAWLATSLVASLTLQFSNLGWWLGHMFELDGILIVAIPVAIDLAQSAQARPLSGDLAGSDLVSAEEVFLGSHVRAITLRLARKDAYTEQHTRRVALRAVQVGEMLGLSRRRLRALAIGGLVHDIGKLSIPDAILKKPGPLDDEEYAVIKRHTELGAKLIDELGGFTPTVRRLVHDHHERLDGTGYPAGMHADDLPIDTRILAVCDVYDALISPRVYRGAWSHADAMALLRAGAGTAFDGRCVEALDAVLSRESGTAPVAPERHAPPAPVPEPAPAV
jgi:HD-GYP domain-containing protein (c-di-GMP phosphodiesterase class II)